MTGNNLINEIEEFLAVTANRDLFTAQEIQDFLLDLRNLADENVDIAKIAAPIEHYVPEMGSSAEIGNQTGATSEPTN